MKTKILVLLCLSMTFAGACASNNEKSCSDAYTYELVPTQNMWTFIKLNTGTGQMWQVQYDVNGDNRGEFTLSPIPQVANNEAQDGRFALYPTQNIYNFILLDRIDGRMWQVQWSTNVNNRGIIPIKQ